MKHLEFMSGSLRYSLTGDCISVFDRKGKALWHKFFESHTEAKKVFLELY